MLKINEIYKSIQGESTYTGIPTVFVRTSGCPLRCSFCDTTYAFFEGSKMSIEKVLEKITAFNTSYICITGGEPLIQKDIFELMQRFCDKDYNVSLETSGALSCQKVDPRVKKIVDVKTPDSGEKGSFLLENIKYINSRDEIKFVICSQEDFNWAVEFVREHHLLKKCTVLFSPSHNQVSAKWLAENILSASLEVRLQIQTHKYIWGADARGV